MEDGFASNCILCKNLLCLSLSESQSKVKCFDFFGKKRISDHTPDFATMKKLLHFELMNWTKKNPKPKRAFHLLALSIKIPSKHLAINYGCASFHITHPSWNLLLLWPEMSQFSSHSEPLNDSRTDQEGISCSRVTNRQKHILHLLWGPFLSQRE